MNPDNIIETTAASAASESDDTQKRTYTVDEIASLLQISRGKAYALCRESHFKTIKVGRAVRISKLSFDEWLDAQ